MLSFKTILFVQRRLFYRKNSDDEKEFLPLSQVFLPELGWLKLSTKDSLDKLY